MNTLKNVGDSVILPEKTSWLTAYCTRDCTAGKQYTVTKLAYANTCVVFIDDVGDEVTLFHRDCIKVNN